MFLSFKCGHQKCLLEKCCSRHVLQLENEWEDDQWKDFKTSSNISLMEMEQSSIPNDDEENEIVHNSS
jgi:hypothetical protein